MSAVQGFLEGRKMESDRLAAERITRGSTATAATPGPILGIYGALRGLMLKNAAGLVVHVVSATPGEGASTIANSIATAAAKDGGKVLLLDGRFLDRDSLPTQSAKAPGLEPRQSEAGLPSAQFLSGQNPRSGLFTGSISNAGSDGAVGASEVRAAYAAWRQDYELVIIDCPAVDSGRYLDLVPDAADHVILVIRAEKVRPAVLIKVRETIEQQGGKILGVILNDARRYIPKFIYNLL